MARQTINVPITGDADPLRRALGDADGHIGRFQSGIGGKLTAIGGAIAGAFAVNAIVDFGREMFNLGQTVEVTNAKMETVFGDLMGTVDDVRIIADTWNESLGLTNSQTELLMANMGDLLKPMGFTTRDAADMASQLLFLSGALSGWSNGARSVTEVSEILTGAILGEYDALKSLGISLSAAEVETRALAMTGKEAAGELTDMEMSLAVQALLFEKSTDAQRAWTDGSMQNVQTMNELNARFAEVKETIAEALYPWMVKAGEWLLHSFVPWIETEVVPVLREWWSWFEEKIVPALRTYWAYLSGPFWQTTQKVIGWIGDKAVPIVEALAAAFEYLPVMLASLEYAWNAVGKPVWEAIRVAVQLVVDAVKELGGALDRVLGPLDEIVGFGFSTAGGFLGLGGGGASSGGTIDDYLRQNPGVGSDIDRLRAKVPKLAAGGVVTAPTLALIGEAGPEAVVPLNRSGMMGGQFNIVVNALDPRTAGDYVVDALESWERRNGRSWRVA
jgi:hypothetical protein